MFSTVEAGSASMAKSHAPNHTIHSHTCLNYPELVYIPRVNLYTYTPTHLYALHLIPNIYKLGVAIRCGCYMGVVMVEGNGYLNSYVV